MGFELGLHLHSTAPVLGIEVGLRSNRLLSLSLSLTHTFSLSLSLSLTHTHTLSHTLTCARARGLSGGGTVGDGLAPLIEAGQGQTVRAMGSRLWAMGSCGRWVD